MSSTDVERREIVAGKLGKINVFIEGVLGSSEVTILTVHDLGCNHHQYLTFSRHAKLTALKQRSVWVHVELPGQGDAAPDLPSDFTFPTMQEIADDLVRVLDELKIKYVVVFGEGAGANILARFAISHKNRVLGAVLIHCTGSTASFLDSMKDKRMGKKLETVGMNPSAESYLLLHRFGSIPEGAEEKELTQVINMFRERLRNSINSKNLKQFIRAFMNRTNLFDKIGNMRCATQFIAGGMATHRKHVQIMYETVIKALKDDPEMRSKVELIIVEGVANVLIEKPEKVVSSLQYFLQGIGLVGHLPMQNEPAKFNRRLSMEEYDKPKGRTSVSDTQSPTQVNAPTGPPPQ